MRYHQKVFNNSVFELPFKGVTTCHVSAGQLADCSTQPDLWQKSFDLRYVARRKNENGQDDQTTPGRMPPGMVVPDRGHTCRPAELSWTPSSDGLATSAGHAKLALSARTSCDEL